MPRQTSASTSSPVFATAPIRWPRTLLLTAALLLPLATGVDPARAAQPGALTALPIESPSLPGWEISGLASGYQLALVDDEILGRKVFEIQPAAPTGKARASAFSFRSNSSVSGAYVAEAWVRFPDTAAPTGKAAPGGKGAATNRPTPGAAASVKAILATGLKSAGAKAVPACRLGGGTGARGFVWDGQLGGHSVKGSLAFNLSAADVSPFSPEAFRLETEAELAAMPEPHKTWIALRIEAGPELVRMYCNGILVRESAPATNSAGGVMLTLPGNETVRVAQLTIRPADSAATPHVMVPLDFRCNAAGPIDLAALRDPSDNTRFHGIPFRLANGASPNDHVDIGASIFRYRHGTRYAAEIDPRVTTPGPAQFEPGRIMLTVPRRAYARAWILAGSEDHPARAPILTLRFFKPVSNWSTDAATTVPSFTATTGGPGARAVAVKTKTGKMLNLWLVPLDLDSAELAADFRSPHLNLELTKEVKPHLAYPDPSNYSYQAGGLPSGVQLYGLTLETAPVWAVGTSDVKGGTYTAPEKPTWRVTLQNQFAAAVPVTVRLEVTDPHGKAVALERQLTVPRGEEQIPAFPLAPATFGLHTVRTVVSAGAWQQSRTGTFLFLPTFDRKATPRDSAWGVWDWSGTHGTNPNKEENARLLRALGAINQSALDSDNRTGKPENLDAFRKQWGLGPTHYRLVPRQVPDWGAKEPVDPADYATYREEMGKRTKAIVDQHPDFQYVNCFAENSISLRLTHGIPPWAFGQPWFEYEDYEKKRIRQMLVVANAAAEGVKQHAPTVKFLFGHGAPNFPAPFFREKDWRPELFAGFGLDMPQFERMPERQPRATEPSLLYFLQKELRERGLADKELVHLESYFPSSHPLALGLRGQADNIVRTAVLSLALGTTKFMHTWSLQDCSDRWGSQHYGGAGLIGREPESHPKPSAAAFATMTRMLDTAKFRDWLPTGSRSAFCLRFQAADHQVYAVWTIHGTRPLALTPDSDQAQFTQTDENGNESPLRLTDGRATVTLTPTVRWVVARRGAVKTALAGAPTYTDAPGPHRLVLEDFEKTLWTADPKPHHRYASNNWDVVREPRPMKSERVSSSERNSTAWRVTLTERPKNQPCAGFFGVFTPPTPILIPGQARALGIHARGASQWHRIVYELKDAKGEIWLSCGEKNAWNSDDIHSRSYLNHDGWRYLEFPLPVTSPGDNFREPGCYSWAGSDDGIVDLPLTLTRVIIELRSDIIYANALLPVDDLSVELDDLTAVYNSPEEQTGQAAKIQLAARTIARPKIKLSALPNPIKALADSGVGAAATIEKIYAPEVMASGDQVFVKIKPVAGAKKYTVYVSAYPDGTGAQATPAKPDKDPSLLFVRGLQPAIPLYFFASYTDPDGKESKPSPARKTVLKDEFPFK